MFWLDCTSPKDDHGSNKRVPDMHRRERVLFIMNRVRVTLGPVTQYVRRVLVSHDIVVLTKDCKKVPLGHVEA